MANIHQKLPGRVKRLDSVFVIEIDSGHPRWQQLIGQPDQYRVVGDVTIRDFPVEEGSLRRVKVSITLFGKRPTAHTVIRRILNSGRRLADRAVAETALQFFSAIQVHDQPIVAVTGWARSDDGSTSVTFVRIQGRIITLGRQLAKKTFARNTQFLVVYPQ